MARYTIRPTGVGLIPHGDKYTVKHLGDTMQGYIDLVRRELGVSLNGDLPWTRFVQLHEMSHVRWSRASAQRIAEGAGVSVESVLAAEDARINTRMLREIPDAHEGFNWEGQPINVTLGGYVASFGAPENLRSYIRSAVSMDASCVAKCEQLDAVYAECLKSGKLTISSMTIPLARALEWKDPKGEGGGKGSLSETEEDALDAKRYGDVDYRPNGKPLIGKREETNGTTQWLIPKVVSPPLDIRVKRPGTHEYASSDGGTILRDVARIASDGAVFGRTLRRPGVVKRGTVLVDVSGSMSLSAEDVEGIVEAVPSATVATYCAQPAFIGYSEGLAQITIIAKDGRRCDPTVGMIGGGNCCDGPALLWLSRMPTPRVWYCDGETTDERDCKSGREEAEAIVRAGRILHIMPWYGMSAAARILGVLRERRMVK